MAVRTEVVVEALAVPVTQDGVAEDHAGTRDGIPDHEEASQARRGTVARLALVVRQRLGIAAWQGALTAMAVGDPVPATSARAITSQVHPVTWRHLVIRPHPVLFLPLQ